MGMMSIRAIGSPTASAGSVAAKYVDYLTSGVSTKGQVQAQNIDGTIDYYDSGIEGPGIWSGHGAHNLGLEGFVDPEELQAVLSGRHHVTGERLLSAQGSAGRYGLKVGEPTREIGGKPVWSRHDLEGHLRLDGDVLTDLLTELEIEFFDHEGESFINATQVKAINKHVTQKAPEAGAASTVVDGEALWSIDDLNTRFGLEEEVFDQLIDGIRGEQIHVEDVAHLTIVQVEQLTEAIHDMGRLEALNNLKPDTLLSAGEAAELIGVSRRYISKVIGNHLDYEADNTPVDGRLKDWLPGERITPDNPRSPWRVRSDDLAEFIERRQPPAVRIAYDVTFSFEKSISVVGLLSEGNDRDEFTTAIQRANQVGLDHLDQHASNGRKRGKPIHSEGLAVASFIHSTSRNDDPFLHVHNLVINAVQDQDGTGRALDGRDIYLKGPTAAALASAELRWQLTQRLGLNWVATENSVEIAGVSEGVIDEFSTGRNRIQSIVEEANLDPNDPKAIEQVQRVSRPDKTGSAPDQLIDEWWERAERHGLDRQTLQEDVLRNTSRLEGPRPELTKAELAELHGWLAGSEGATRNASIFTKGELLRAIGEWTPEGEQHVRVMPAKELERAADTFLASPHVVPLDLDREAVAQLAGKVTAKMQHDEVFTTRRMLRLQENISNQWEDGLDSSLGIVDDTILQSQIQASKTLTDAQVNLVTQWTTSGHQFQSAVGVPGAGKTFAVSTAARAWEEEGYTVIGAAVSGTAAQHLGQDANIPSETLAYYITQIEEFGNAPLDARTVLIVDEAGTISDQDLSAILTHASTAGTTVRFLGDPEQHGAVNAGGMWKHLINTHDAPELLESFRFKDSPHDVEVNDLLRQGDLSGAYRVLRESGNLIEVGSEQEALALLARRSLKARDADQANPMLDRTNANRIVLNSVMQELRIHRGEVTDVRDYGHRQYGIDDEIVSKRNDRTLHPEANKDDYLRNGTKGVIIDHDDQAHTVVADFGSGPIEIPAELFETPRFDLAYASTSQGVQGLTHATQDSHIKAGASQAENIVNLSRGRENNSAILSGKHDEEFSGFHEPSGTSLANEVAENMSASQDVPALVVDQDAGRRNHGIIDELRNSDNSDDVRLARQALKRHVLAHPPHQLTEALPPKATVPHLARSYDAALVEAMTYHVTYQPLSSDGPWGDVLGERPDPEQSAPQQVARYDRAVEALAAVSVDTALRSLSDVGQPAADLPQWVPVELEALAKNGVLTPDFNPEAFARVAKHIGDNPDQGALAQQLAQKPPLALTGPEPVDLPDGPEPAPQAPKQPAPTGISL